MIKEKEKRKVCKVELVLRDKEIWGLLVKGCNELLDEIRKKQGPYANRYLFDRVERVKD
jgi:hypothetical protein